MNLFTPGPVNVPQRIADAIARNPLHHRSEAFKELSANVWSALKRLFKTESTVSVLAGSAMTGIEACIAGLHKHGDTVVVITNGRFGERIAEICKLYGLNVVEIDCEWGTSVLPEAVAQTVKKHSLIGSLWFVHSETSTGVLLDAQGIAQQVRSVSPNTLICTDAVTSIGVHHFEMDAWGIDVAIAGVQKGLMCPPGLACVAMSERAVNKINTTQQRTYTMNLQTIMHHQSKGLFTWTPPVTLIAGLNEALKMIEEEGIQAVGSRHKAVAEAVRNGFVQRGYKVFGEATSNALVCIQMQNEESRMKNLNGRISNAKLIKEQLLSQHDIMIAGGQDKLEGKIIRIGTCGSRTVAEVELFFNAFDSVVKQVSPA